MISPISLYGYFLVAWCDVEQDVFGTTDVVFFEQRWGQCHVDGGSRSIHALSLAVTHEGHAWIFHYKVNVFKVNVDISRYGDDLRYGFCCGRQTLSALSKACVSVRSPYISFNLSLEITRMASTFFQIFQSLSNACLFLRMPSKWKGRVTMPTVRMPISWPPWLWWELHRYPYLRPCLRLQKHFGAIWQKALISSMDSIHASFAVSGLDPALPSVRLGPNAIFFR